MSAVRAVAVSLGREVARSRHRVALTYLVPVIPPVVAVTLFSDVMSPAVALPGFPATSYQDYMTAGAVLLPGMMAAGLTATGVGEDLRSGFADRLRLLGVSPAADTLGRLAFEGVRILPSAAVAYAVGVWLGEGLGFETLSMLALLALAATWAMAYNGVFHLLAALTASPHAPVALQPLFAPLTFLSVFWFPGDLMPDWGRTVTAANPVSWLTDAALAFTIDDVQVATVAAGVATVAVTMTVFWAATARTLRRRWAR